jgi:uridine kinase
MPGEIPTLDPALAASGHRQQSTDVSARHHHIQELVERTDSGMLWWIYRDLVNGHDRSRMTVHVGACDHERTGPQLADADDRRQKPEGIRFAGKRGDGVHGARYWTAEAVDCRDDPQPDRGIGRRYRLRMLVASARRSAVLTAIALQVVALQPGYRVRVAVDGVDGAGKSTFADELAERIVLEGRPVVRAAVDGFHRPREERYRLGRMSPEGFYRNSYDYERLTEVLLRPFGPGGSGRYRAAVFNHVTNMRVTAPEGQADADAVLILDGIFLHRPELHGCWDFSIFLQVGFDVSVPRCARRDGTSPDPSAATNQRYVQGQRQYLHEAKPWEQATVIVDNTDLSAPAVIRPDRFRLAPDS